MNALRAFEAAGRNLSFSLAAEELHVTQGAISRQVRILESYLGEMLFVRGPRGVSLTEQGKRYLELTSHAFDSISQGMSRQPASRKQLSVSILPSVATLWLQERLSAFEFEHPDIRLTVSSSQRPVNFDQDGVDVALRVGMLPTAQTDKPPMRGDLDMVINWNGVEAIQVWQEEAAPLCSKTYWQSLGGLGSVKDLERATLIHNESRPNLWGIWLGAHGYQAPRNAKTIVVGQRYAAVLAVREGRGMACVPTKDINMLSWRDELMFPFGQPVSTGNAYYLLHRSDSVRAREARLLCDWIQDLMNQV
ncbi:LysR substrate-binding domain-containing protein [Parapusillimonas sp. JC17]|uniref:LysR substrate-binding domain-containing protein n=1 Tax=Parapusillimonas sp. JC17 TaxID=3445768 RepID=UPI003FA0E703